MVPDEVVLSPRLRTLQAQLEAGDAAALDGFWQEMKAQGTPLIEAIEGNDSQCLVTFLWRGNQEHTTVLIFGGMAQPDGMVKLPGSELWFKSYRLPRDSRFTYELGPSNHPAAQSTQQQWNPELATWQPDPLNPRTLAYPHDEEGAFYGYTASLVALEDAQPQVWIEKRENVPAGSVEQHRFRSKLLRNERRIWVYTPPNLSYHARPCDLLLLFDGFIYSRVVPMPTILDNLLADGQIQPTLAIMLESPDRVRELAANPDFVDFLTGVWRIFRWDKTPHFLMNCRNWWNAGA